VIFVAFFSVLLGAEPLSATTWLAALLTTIATALLGIGRTHRVHSLSAGLFYGFSAAACFALVDVFCQKWAPLWGFGHFAPAMFATVTICSLGLIPFFSGSLRELQWRWVLPGGMFLGLQCIGVAYAIMVFGSATTTNIMYSSRGIWSVILVWTIGHWFANVERTQGTPVMLRRLAGSALLLAAIGLIAYR
jgi:drug/metabolite transporter (DMT)-like permease